REVATTPAPELQGLYRILGSLLVPRHVLEVLVDGPRQADEKLASVGRSVLAQELGGPAIELAMGRQRRDEASEVRPIFGGVGKRIGSGKIIDIGCVEAPRRVIEVHAAVEAKLRGTARETGGRDMIAEDILRPGKLARLWRNSEFGFKHLLVVVVA